MKLKSSLATLGIALAVCAFCATGFAGDKKAAKKSKTDIIIVETDPWYPYPFYYEPIDWFHDAEVSYRKKEEKAAASNIRKAESWLNYAAKHALPKTQKSLKRASADLKTLADDLEKGKVANASRLSAAVSRASAALAEWHYFNATDKKLAKDEENWAENNLKAAAMHIKNAANSSDYEYGDEFVTVYDDWFGWEDVEIDTNKQEENLKTVKSELDKLADALKK